VPIDLSRVPEELKVAAKTGNLVPFIGAGVSRQAKARSKPFPTWTELICDLGDLAKGMNRISPEDRQEIGRLVDQGKYLMAAQALKEELDADILESFLHTCFADSGAEPGAIHERLFALRPSLILTTNYDLLLENAYWKTFNVAPTSMTFRQAADVVRFMKIHHHRVDRPLIFHIHGTAAKPSETVFSEEDYRRLRYREHGYRNVLSAIFITRVVLMLGFSGSDPEISLLTESLRESLDHRNVPEYIVLPKGEKGEVEKKRLRRDFGLQVIEYDKSEDHHELLELVEYLVGFVPGQAGLTANA